MEIIADILLISGAVGAGIYCFVLSRRLSRFMSLENGVGGAIAVLSDQVEGMTRALAEARKTSSSSAKSLEGLTNRADGVAQRLELLVAAMHDLPVQPKPDRAHIDRQTMKQSDCPEFQSQRCRLGEATE